MNKEYTTIDGDAAYTKLTAELAFGEGNAVTAAGRNATFQVGIRGAQRGRKRVAK